MTELVQNINNLIDRMHNDPDWTDYVQLVTDALQNCIAHMELVAREEALLQSARIRLSEAKFKDFQLRLNETRQLRYDAVIHYINLLNKLAKTNKLPPIAPDVDATRPETYIRFARQVADEYCTTGPIGGVSES